MRKFLCVFVSVVTLCSLLCVGASAQTYSTNYPSCGNSGSPYWIHCQIRDLGDFLIVLDPNINPQSFGFDTPKTGYNLINNTADVIYGRAYATNGTNTAYLVRFPSYYRITMQTGFDAKGDRTVYEDHKILNIYGTTLDLIDYTGDRDNDLYKHDIPDRQQNIIVVSLLFAVVLLFVISLLFKPRFFRM